MFEKFRSAAIALSVFVVLLGIGAYVMVQMGGGDKLFGGKEGSLPPVDFGVLDRSFDDPSYLLCAKNMCPNADVDGPAPRFDVPAQKLRLAIVDFADNMPTVNTFRFVTRANWRSIAAPRWATAARQTTKNVLPAGYA